MRYIKQGFTGALGLALRLILTALLVPILAVLSFIGLLAVNFVLAVMLSIMMLKMTYNLLFK